MNERERERNGTETCTISKQANQLRGSGAWGLDWSEDNVQGREARYTAAGSGDEAEYDIQVVKSQSAD